MSVLFNPKWRLAWAAGSALITAVSVGVDAWLRSSDGQSPLAPTATVLWFSVGLGAAMGLVGMLWERYLLRHRREFLLTFHSTSLQERLSWKYQRRNLLLGGWFVLGLLALIGWCAFAGVSVLPVIFAENAVQLAGNPRLAGEFNAELFHEANTEPDP